MYQHQVSETRLDGLRPLGVGGQPLLDRWQTIERYLRAELGDAHAELFAEPVRTADGGVSWFCAPEGEQKAFGELDDAKQTVLLREFVTLVSQIREKIEHLRRRNSKEAEKTLAQTLERALATPERRPDREFLFEVDGRPVLVNWGLEDDAPTASGRVLEDFVKVESTRLAIAEGGESQKEDPDPPRVDDVRPIRVVAGPATLVVADHVSTLMWPLWLLFTALTLAIFYVLLLGCAVGLPLENRPSWLSHCPVGPAAAAAESPEIALGEALERELLELERRLAQLPRCPIAEPPPPPANPAPQSLPVPAPEPAPEFDEADQEADEEADGRVEQGGGANEEWQVTLLWDADADLDLHIVCPSGQRIFHGRKQACDGVLDIDANSSAVRANPVENIAWSAAPPPGLYRVIVKNYSGRSAGRNGPVPFTVRARLGGSLEVVRGSINAAAGERVVLEFDAP